MSFRVGRILLAGVSAMLACACSDEATPSDDGGGAPSHAGVGGAGGQTNGGSASQPMAGSAGSAAGASAGGSSQAGAGGSSQAGAGGSSAGAGGASAGTSSGGSAGAAGQAGGAGTSQGGSAGAGATDPSDGCKQAASIALNQWVDSMVMTGGKNRPYSVRLPSKYDANRAYPVIMLLHGCGSGTNNVPMENATGENAILVRGTGSAADTCWDTKANGPDVAFFDAMVADVKARFCADEKRFFAVGYSSGSWLANQLTCIRANVLRGAGTVTGGESAAGGCGGPVARIFIHDDTDKTNVISGSEKARDRQLTQNMCNKSAAPMPVDPSPCQLYQGCATGYPVEWCKTTGKEHGRQDSFAPTTFWNFFKAL